MELYKCRYCLIERPVSEFVSDKTHPAGHRTICKRCEKLRKQMKKDIANKTESDKIIMFEKMYFSELLLSDIEWSRLFSVTLEDIFNWRIKLDIKKCYKCGEVKSLSNFNKCCVGSNRDGYFSYCIDCYLEYHSEYRQNEEKMEIRKHHIKRYYEKNKEEIIRRTSEYILNKHRTDPYFRLVSNFRNLFRNYLYYHTNGQITKNMKHTEEILGYTFKDLVQHLESQFDKDENLCWENYGSYWHVDHIIPVSSFDLTDSEQFHQCWSLQNLQPLCATDNLKKSNKIIR